MDIFGLFTAGSDYDGLFGGLPERTVLQRQLRTQEVYTDLLIAEPSVLNVVDSFPMELIFPIREGRSDQQYGTKNKDKGRWSVGLKVAWILNTFGQVCGWTWNKMHCHDNEFLDYLVEFNDWAVLLADWGFRCKDGIPESVQLCKKALGMTAWWSKRLSPYSLSFAKPRKSIIVWKLILKPDSPILLLCSISALSCFMNFTPKKARLK